jgi:hypothetical protein
VADTRIIDVSNFQRSVDWGAVLGSGVAGGICKATEGLSYRDPTFPANWSALGQRNAFRGAYHFGHPDQDPVAQADFFLGYVGAVKPTDLLVLDLETGTGNMDAFAWNFLVHVQARTGVAPVFYSYGPFIRAHLTDRRLATFKLWLAAYQPNRPACPAPWTSYALWQHTDSARVPGVAGAVDESFLIDPAALAAPTAQVVRAMYDPPIGPIAAVWQNPDGCVVAGVSPDGDVYAWGTPWQGNVRGKSYWGNRKAAAIGPRDDGVTPGYLVTATSGEKYRLPDGMDKL